MNPYEVILTVGGGLLSLIVGIVGFLAKSALTDLKHAGDRMSAGEQRITRLEASEIRTMVDRHESRLSAVEASMGEIKGDLKHILNKLEDMTRRTA